MSEKSSNKSMKYALKSLSEIEKELISNYMEALNAIRIELLKVQDRLGDNFTMAEMTKYNRFQALRDAIESQLKLLARQNYKLIEANRKDNFLTAYNNEIDDIGISLANIDNESLKKFLAKPISGMTVPEILKDLSYDTKKKLDRIIAQTLIQGKSIQKTAKEIKETINVSAKRAVTIARTEILRAMSMGQDEWYDRMKSRGFDVRKKWLAYNDGRTRPDHIAMDNVLADEDGVFTFPDGTTMTAPRTSGVAAQDINCRCRMITVVLNTKNEQQNEEAHAVLEENV
jgi:hypothetical protein